MAGKVTGHGNHWRTLWGEDYDPERDVLRAVRRTLARPARRDVRELPDRRRLDVFFSAEAGLGLCAFLIGDTVISAYPYVRGGTAVTLRTREVVPWQSGFEAQVVAEANGGELAFFALDAYRNVGRYKRGREQRVLLNGLLYRGSVTADRATPSLRTLAGEQIGRMHFDVDEFTIVGQVADALPMEALRLDLLLCRVEMPMLRATLPIYLRPEVLSPPPERSFVDQFLGRWPLRGRWLEGQVWLVGYLADT